MVGDADLVFKQYRYLVAVAEQPRIQSVTKVSTSSPNALEYVAPLSIAVGMNVASVVVLERRRQVSDKPRSVSTEL